MVKYTIDWGDGRTTETDYSNSGKVIITQHMYSETGTYTITVSVKDRDDMEASSTNTYSIKVLNRQPSKPVQP